MIKPTLLALSMLGMLSVCDTAEDRAAAHFASARALLEEGDVDRALVELRNVLRLDGQHRAARRLFAEAERDRGNARAAYGQYMRLVEQYPDSEAGQRALAAMALEFNDWDAARRHGRRAAELAPDDPLVQAVTATVAYRDARAGDDPDAAAAAVRRASALVEDHPDLMVARRVLIDDLIRRQDWTGALAAIDAALARAPERRDLYTTRLGVLNRLGETAEIRAQLEDMVARFPDDPNVPDMLIRWHLSQGDPDAAEAFLRSRAEAGDRTVEDIVTYIRFLSERRGAETARDALDRILQTDPPAPERLRALHAGFRFDLGARDAAIADLETLVERMDPSDQRRDIMVMLARMRDATGNRVGARALVEEVLAQDPAQVAALKMRAGWLIEGDRVDEAIAALRTALGEAPEDAGAMTLLARAHERAGNRELMAEMLGRAVEASGNAPQESLRQARHLIGQDNLRSAESVLIDALRLAPGNTDLLSALGEVYMREQDWPRLDRVIETLRDRDGPAAARIANTLTARRLAVQNREDELMGFLDTLAGEGARGIGAAVAIVRARLAQGDAEAARSYARETLEANPGNRDARFLMASVQAVTGEAQKAEARLRDLAEEAPQEARVWLALYNIAALREDDAAAEQALRDGIAAVPEDLRLNWALAGRLERAGDIEGAIDIYERLYAANSDNLIIANNLASLLATGREDAADLDRAHEIARRLRGREVPAFQDTYGWIAFRRGDLDTAVAALEPAAAALPGDASVQYHLARTYEARGQDAAALAQYRKAAEAVDAARAPDFLPDFLPGIEAAIDRLSAAAGAQDDADAAGN